MEFFGGTAVSQAPFETIITIADVTVTTPAAALASNSCQEVMLKNTGSNPIRIGDSNVSATRGHPLQVGEGVVWPVSNTDKIYHIREGGSDSTMSVVAFN